VLAGVTLQFAKLLPHTLLNGLFADLDGSKHFTQSTLDADCILQVSLHHEAWWKTYGIEEMSSYLSAESGAEAS
jgi:hypothetical protein